jgi:misacylated tRNA(Ala) deacylase
MKTKELYLEHSYLQECQANILNIQDNKVILDQTILYPGGGGQEPDQGYIMQGDKEFEILKVKKENGEIVHYINNAEDLTKGSVNIKLDWVRRHGLMRHHSLLHVLATVVHDKYGSLCDGNQIYEDRARIDFNNLSDLTEEELQFIVEETNKHISNNLEISSRFVTREEAEQIPGSIKTLVNLLPPAVQEIRLVRIANIDEQACGGTHVKKTGEIGKLEITKVKSKGKDSTRLEVLALM